MRLAASTPPQIEFRSQTLFAFFAAMALIGGVVWYSRLLILLTGQRVATLGIVIPILCVATLPALVVQRSHLKLFLFLAVSAALICLWLLQFTLNTGYSGDWRTFGSFNGIYLAIPALVLMQILGMRRALRVLYYVCLAYVVVYIAFSIAVSVLGMYPDVPGLSVILQDPVRGRRIYPDTALIGFPLFYLIGLLRNREFRVRDYIALGLVAIAILFSQSRISMALYAVIGLVSLIPLANSQRIVTLAFLIGELFFVLILAYDTEVVVRFLRAFNDQTLSLRVASFDTAYSTFLAHPVLGIGFPGNASFYQMAFGYLFFPDDLGVIGVLCSYGLVGFVWLAAIIVIAYLGGVHCNRFKIAETRALAWSGTLIIATTVFSPNIFQGDGSVIWAFLAAAWGSSLPTSRTIMRAKKQSRGVALFLPRVSK